MSYINIAHTREVNNVERFQERLMTMVKYPSLLVGIYGALSELARIQQGHFGTFVPIEGSYANALNHGIPFIQDFGNIAVGLTGIGVYMFGRVLEHGLKEGRKSRNAERLVPQITSYNETRTELDYRGLLEEVDTIDADSTQIITTDRDIYRYLSLKSQVDLDNPKPVAEIVLNGSSNLTQTLNEIYYQATGKKPEFKKFVDLLKAVRNLDCDLAISILEIDNTYLDDPKIGSVTNFITDFMHDHKKRRHSVIYAQDLSAIPQDFNIVGKTGVVDLAKIAAKWSEELGPNEGQNQDPIDTVIKSLRDILSQDIGKNDKTIVEKAIVQLALDRNNLQGRKRLLKEFNDREISITILPHPLEDEKFPSNELKQKVFVSLGAITEGETLENLWALSYNYIHNQISAADRKRLINAGVDGGFGRYITLPSNIPGCHIKVYLIPWTEIQLLMDEKTVDTVIKHDQLARLNQ